MDVGELVDAMGNMVTDDGGANYIQLHENLAMIDQIVSFLVGLLVVVIAVGIPLIVALEVLYINIPTIQDSMDKFTEGNKRLERIIGLCFRDARLALYRANTSETGKSANMCYLGIKIKAILLAFIVIGLALGAFDFIVDYLVKWITKLLYALI